MEWKVGLGGTGGWRVGSGLVGQALGVWRLLGLQAEMIDWRNQTVVPQVYQSGFHVKMNKDSEPISVCFCLPPLCLSPPTSSPFTSPPLPPLPPLVLSMPPNRQICVSTHILLVFTSGFLFSLSFTYSFCLKSLSSPRSHPAHLNNPITVFIHLFFLFSFPLALFGLLSVYPLFHPVACPCLSLSLSPFRLIFPWLDLTFLSHYLPSFISLLHCHHNYFVSAAFLCTLLLSLHI